ncbi:MAG: GxxExxY protein [Planctomycetota bacterium]
MAMRWSDIPAEINALSERVIGCAIEVHRTLGPGLAEAIYEAALSHELDLAGIPYQQQVVVRSDYKGVELPPQRLDLVVDNTIVLELKATERIADAHLAQLLSYLHYGRYPVGLLLNFNTPVLTQSIHRRVNERALRPQPRAASSAISASSPRPPRTHF